MPWAISQALIVLPTVPYTSARRVVRQNAPNAGVWERHYEQTPNDYDPRDEEFYRAAQQAGS